jgi:hypothetical protein
MCITLVAPSSERLSGRFGGASVVVHMCLSTMFFLFVDVRDMRMFNRRVVVIVGVGGEQVHPVLTLMKVMRHVVMLVAVLDGLVLVTTVSPSHRGHLLPDRSACSESDDRTTPSESAYDPQHRRDKLRRVSEKG